jgi:hypothetical protein
MVPTAKFLLFFALRKSEIGRSTVGNAAGLNRDGLSGAIRAVDSGWTGAGISVFYRPEQFAADHAALA